MYGFQNAELISTYYTPNSSVFEVLTEFQGFDELQLLGSNGFDGLPLFNSSSDQKEYFDQLPISEWSEEMIIGSLIFFILETTFECKNIEKFSLSLPYIIDNIAPFMFNPRFSLVFSSILKETRIIENSFNECCFGFKFFLKKTVSVFDLKQKSNCNKESLINFLLLLKATNSEINYIVNSCFNSNSLKELKEFIEKSTNLQ